MFRKKQPNRLKLFYYSHPYFVIFNVLIIYNVILIALAALLMTYLMKGITSDGFTWAFNMESYLKNLEYCVVFTMNNGGIYNDAPISVIILKVVLSILQMITFTGALIGLATSILQSMFDHRIHNVGKIKIKHHYVVLEWSAVGPNLVRELSFIRGNKTIVILSNKNRDEIQEEIDDLFLETGTEKKHLKIFVKNGNPSSRKALKEINIDKAEAIAILGASSWLNTSEQNDSISFKILMSVISLTKNANIVIETDDQEVTKNIHDLMEASSELKDARISLFSRNTIVGHVLAKTAINADYPNLYYSLLSFRNGSFFAIDKPYSIEEALAQYSSCLPAFRYKCDKKEYLFVNAEKEESIRRSLLKKKRSSVAPYKKKIVKSPFTLYVIGKNDRSEAIEYAVREHNSLNEGKVNLKILPTDCDINELLEDIANEQGKKKILILSDNNASEENIDANVFLSLIKIKANKELSKDIDVFAEIFEPSNRFSLEALNISGVIIANQMVAVYMTQLLCHAESHKLYEDLLTPDSNAEVTFEIRQAKELLTIKDKENLEFSSRGDFIYALYNSSKQEYLPIGFIGEKKRLGLTDVVGGAVTGVIEGANKVITGITNVLTLSDAPGEASVDFTDVLFLNKNINKKDKIIIRPDTTMIVVHKNK